MAYLIALDIDGTTLTHGGDLLPEVVAAVRRVRDAGHHLVMATGRQFAATLPVMRDLGLTEGYAVCCNGAVTMRVDPALPEGSEVVDLVSFDPGPALALLKGSWHDGVVTVETVGGRLRSTGELPDISPREGERVPWERLGEEPVTRIAVYSPTATSEEFAGLARGLGLHGVTYAVGYTAWLDINPEGVSKASALELVRRALGVAPDETVAVGDQRNDIAMLSWASYSVAMGDAPEEVRAAASVMTATSEEGGLAPVLNAFLDGDPVGGPHAEPGSTT